MVVGFRTPERYATVRGEEEYAGFEARVLLAPVPLGLQLSFQRRITSGDPQEIEDTIREFGDVLLSSWNVVDGIGVPVPADGDGLLTQDLGLAQALIGGWSEALASPPLATGAPPAPGSIQESGNGRTNGAKSSSSTRSASGGASRHR